jgi:hypothetical protein
MKAYVIRNSDGEYWGELDLLSDDIWGPLNQARLWNSRAETEDALLDGDECVEVEVTVVGE